MARTRQALRSLLHQLWAGPGFYILLSGLMLATGLWRPSRPLLPPPGGILVILVMWAGWVRGPRAGLLAATLAIPALAFSSGMGRLPLREGVFPVLVFGLVAAASIWLVGRHWRLLKMTEQAAQESDRHRAYLQGVVDALVEGLLLYDAQGRLIQANRTATGPLGLLLDQGLHPDDHEAVEVRNEYGQLVKPEATPLGRALRGEIVREDTITLWQAGQETASMVVSAVPVGSESGELRAAVLTYRDISRDRHVARRKDEFLVVLLHELRTSWTAVLGYLQLIESDVESGQTERLGRMLAVVEQQMQQLQSLAIGLLEVTRLELGYIPISPVWLDLRSVVTQAADVLRATGTNRVIEVRLPESPVLVQADPVRLAEVLNHLLDNALKYSPADTPVELFCQPDGTVCVRDFGLGISPEDRDRIFEPFMRGRNEPERKLGNLGLGLYIAQAIVRGHGGKLTVDSAPGQGSTFYFQIPQTD